MPGKSEKSEKSGVWAGRLPSFLRTADRKLFTLRVAPYRAGMGPTFTVTAYDSYKYGPYGHSYLSFELTVRRPFALPGDKGRCERFAFAEWCGIPAHQTIDGNEAKRAVLTTVAVKPGDTDMGFFEGYPQALLDIVTAHGETLSLVASDRYGEG